MKTANSVLDLIGSTPAVKLNRISRSIKATLYAKLEFLNPSGSIKDRVAKRMIEEAKRKRVLKPGATLVEPSTGNMGIAMSLVASLKGYRAIVVMPRCVSEERMKIIRSYGAKIVLTPKEDLMMGAIMKAKELAKEPGHVILNQFENPANTDAHRETGKEILAQIEGRIDAFVASVGTGGTFIGVSETLKKQWPDMKTVAVEPSKSAVLSGGEPGFHRIEGIGEGFVPELLKPKTHLIDEVVTVEDDEAFDMARRLIREEGLFAGVSSGANVYASVQVAKDIGKGNVVTLLPDSADRYFSTALFE